MVYIHESRKKLMLCQYTKKVTNLKNYRPVPLLPICSKIFERLLYNEIFGFFLDKGLISANQSGFKPGDSCINQLLSTTRNIYKSFDDGYEVRGVFLDISKAFHQVWHDGLIFKLQENGVSGNFENFETFFDKWKTEGCIKWVVFFMD